MAKGKYQKWLEEDNLIKLQGWARDGLTDKQIAHNIGITEQTLNVWKKKFPSFFEALKKGKEVVDIEVENALLKRALGYRYNEVKQKTIKGVVVETQVTTKEIPPDVAACVVWLKNRKPKIWRDKVDHDNNDALNKLDKVLNELDRAIG